jgi:hypothetical protein
MTASLSRSPPRADAPHCPPLAARPLTLRAWPSRPRHNGNDNDSASILDALAEAAPTVEAAAATPQPRSRFAFAAAVYGLAGALSLMVAAACLIAR